MPKPIGPTIPRWQLGEQLARLRDDAAVSQAQIADRLGCSVSKIQKIEAGDVGIVRAELMVMLDSYGVPPDARMREDLLELQSLGKQRGWWSKFGPMPTPFATFLGLESAATTIRVFEPLMVYGLLQTPEYARVIAQTCGAGEPDDVDRQVRIRLERQRRVLNEDPPRISVILDEAVLHRETGGPRVMAAQLQSLLELPPHISLRIVPFASGGYPGVLGSLTIFEFPKRMHSPVAYVETQAGNLYMEKEDELRRCNVTFGQLASATLSPDDSAKLVTSVANQYQDIARSHS
jgi:transcriptional regulator with XRE-family HTH domain